jgi:LmbE family N-acetylglucosaminyl deacetylase
MGTVILSPHLDDAVLSCWHLLTRPEEVTVINVFAGIPSLSAPAWWDRCTGASDSAERARERVGEDRRALALAGRTPANLDLLDAQYREAEQPVDPPTGQIVGVIEPGSEICAPAAFGAHPDHLLVRAAALELRAQGYAVSLYADLPHATVNGWPSWVRRGRGHAATDIATASWDRALAATGIPSSAMTPNVYELAIEPYAEKLRAVQAYATQVRSLAALMDYPLSDRRALGYEVVWTLPTVSTAKPARAGDRATHHR